MAKGIKKRLRSAMRRVRAEISANAVGNRYASGLANEGYAGGYAQALDDVMILLNGHYEPKTRGYWQVAPSKMESK